MSIDVQNIIVIAVVVVCVAVALLRTVKFYRSAKNGDSCCGCGSTHCKARCKGSEELPECGRDNKSSDKKLVE